MYLPADNLSHVPEIRLLRPAPLLRLPLALRDALREQPRCRCAPRARQESLRALRRPVRQATTVRAREVHPENCEPSPAGQGCGFEDLFGERYVCAGCTFYLNVDVEMWMGIYAYECTDVLCRSSIGKLSLLMRGEALWRPLAKQSLVRGSMKQTKFVSSPRLPPSVANYSSVVRQAEGLPRQPRVPATGTRQGYRCRRQTTLRYVPSKSHICYLFLYTYTYTLLTPQYGNVVELAAATGEFSQSVGDLSASDIGKGLSHSLSGLADVERMAQEIQSTQSEQDLTTIMGTGTSSPHRMPNSYRCSCSRILAMQWTSTLG